MASIVALLAISLAYAVVIPPAAATHSSSCSPTIAPPSGYCVTSDFHGILVPLGTTVNVMAFTTDTSVTRVRFIWNAPDGTIPFDTIDTTPTTAPSGANRFDSINTVAIEGSWGVRAIFCTGSIVSECDANHNKFNDTEALRATSFEGVPEFEAALPIITTLGFAGVVLARKLAPAKAKSKVEN